MLALLRKLAAGSDRSRMLGGKLACAPIGELPELLDAAAEDGRRWLFANGHLGGQAAERIEMITGAMAWLAKSIRAAGDPAAVHEAERNALDVLVPGQRR